MIQEHEVFLGIGDYYATTRPSKVRTVLGSCISVTMHYPIKGYGAICHASLPVTPPGQGADFRYIDQVIPMMAGWFDRHNIPRQELEVKLFGGGDMYGKPGQPGMSATVGHRNIISAKQVLREQGLLLSTSDVGGSLGRNLTFHTSTGKVWVRKNPRYIPSIPPRPPGKAFS
jgi:chemotaxis protein CheD